MKQARDPLYRRHRFPAGVISYAVWLYFRFPLSLRMVEEMLAARGIDVSHESVRHWAEKFGREYSNRIRRRAPARGDKWHMDEVVITIRGRKHWLWRAVDQQGFVLDVLVQSRRDRAAAQRLMRKLLKKVGQSAQRHDYRQAQIVWRCAQGHGSWDRTSPAQGAKQSGGKCPSADKTTGADCEAV